MERANVSKLDDNTFIIECFLCEGTGCVEDGIFCLKPISECCGGCYTYTTCHLCEGTMILEPLDDEMLDQLMMLRAIDNVLEKFKVIHKTSKARVAEDIQAEYDLAGMLKQKERYEKLYAKIFTEIKDRYRDAI
jgi:hypothetical protein